MAYQQPFYMNSPPRPQPVIPGKYPQPIVQSRPPQSYPSNIPQGYCQPQYQQPTLPLKQQPVTLQQQLQYQQPPLGYPSTPYQPGPVYPQNAPRPTQIYNPSYQPQYRQPVQQQVLPRSVQQPYSQTCQPPQQLFQPPLPSNQYPQLKPQYQQQLVQQSIQNKPTQPPNQSRPQQASQQRPPQQIQPQQQRPQQNSQKDQHLEEKFKDAINKDRDSTQKYKNPQQPQKKSPDDEQEQQLQELALQYEDGYIYRGQGYEPAMREGFGVLTDQNDNEVYSGYWHDNQYHGQGKLINFQAEQIEGIFDYQDLSGIENGWLGYEGEFLEGKMHGSGKLQLTNGEKFEGNFNDGMIDGEGVYSTFHGQTVKGVWKEGILINYI
ncbi:unnamed protein product (macronuclear) [Paramecium tetraurelia]|uniref:MORN repeat protein n=1 Tax=Paramecium tetraurelia TaxID=5888 RepID=A0E7X4_PARTE|nr:uncharacterized protein GSPATT00024119001 [Paramecium tetraurelia]CAK91391.1 unnamed protein product [Paramecium tetraurelia]|eukprot:XP_001458788.1 hypothetical protein (macronuclear) [Paramecium tetraurelia strain d4-2]